MSLTQIEKLEKSPTFWRFIKNFGFFSYSEYLSLFWNDIRARLTTVREFQKYKEEKANSIFGICKDLF